MDELEKLQAQLQLLLGEADSLQKKGALRSPDEKTRLKALALGDGDVKSLIAQAMDAISAAKAKQEEESRALKALADAHSFLNMPAPTPINGPARSQFGRLSAEAKPNPPRSLGEFVVTSPQFQKALSDGTIGVATHKFDFSGPETDSFLKAVMTTSAGYTPETIRVDRDTEIRLRTPTATSLFPVTTNAPLVIQWMKQTTRTNAAASRAEGAATAQSTRVWTPQTTTCQNVAAYQPVTREQIQNAAQARTVIDRQLMEEVDVVVEDLLLNGNGTSPNIRGVLQHAGVLTHLMGTDSEADALRKAVTKVQIAVHRMPTAILLHPNDLQDLELKKDSTGQYLLGNPLLSVTRNWRVPVIPCLALAENTALVGDFSSAERWVNSALSVEVGWINDDFIKGQLCVKAEIRQTLTVYRENAFCVVTLADS